MRREKGNQRNLTEEVKLEQKKHNYVTTRQN
jgi:hypothetical protein